MERRIESILPRGKKPFEVYGIIWDFLDRGGKRFRPLMCITACEAFGGKKEDALPVAASIELFHNFTLVHDDIEDNSL
ncbi:MAG TPA: polyprenyl synthetase family protein, partial [Candidatus Micrarchaeota archaeon]|nr:polyprenyl synthetase family protein [Candidatus Micrarchaeota archaeon]